MEIPSGRSSRIAKTLIKFCQISDAADVQTSSEREKERETTKVLKTESNSAWHAYELRLELESKSELKLAVASSGGLQRHQFLKA